MLPAITAMIAQSAIISQGQTMSQHILSQNVLDRAQYLYTKANNSSWYIEEGKRIAKKHKESAIKHEQERLKQIKMHEAVNPYNNDYIAYCKSMRENPGLEEEEKTISLKQQQIREKEIAQSIRQELLDKQKHKEEMMKNILSMLKEVKVKSFDDMPIWCSSFEKIIDYCKSEFETDKY